MQARISNAIDTDVDSFMGLDGEVVRVGGVTSFVRGSESSSGSIALLAAAVAAVMAIATGGWFARRRWLAGRL